MKDILRDRPAAARVLGATLVLVLVAGVFAAVARRGDVHVSGAGRLEVDGIAVLTRARGGSVQVTHAADLRDGDVVEAKEGTFTIRLVGGATFEGRASAAKVDASKVKAGPTPEVVAGEVLVVAPRATRADVAGNHVEIRPASDGPGVARLSRLLAMRLGAYHGSAVLDSAGQQRTIPALRSIEVAVLGRPAVTPKPLVLDHPDSWDRRYLGEAIDLGQSLQSLSNAYSPTLRANEGRTAAYYEALLPGLEASGGLDDGLVQASPTRPQGELLVGAAIASLGRTSSLADRWRAVFAFRDDGAAWGLVALDQGVSSGPLLDAVRSAVDRTTFQFAAALPAATTTRPAGAVPGTTAPPTGTAPTTAPPSTSPPEEPPPTTAPPITTPPFPILPIPTPTLPSPIPEPPSGTGGAGALVGGVVNTVGQLLGGLLGG